MQKILIISILALVGLSTYLLLTTPHTENDSEFQQWLQKYNVKLAGEDLTYRRQIFYENLEKINQHNAQNKGTKQEANKFAILTSDEFNKMYKGYKKSGIKITSQQTIQNTTVPTTIDWRQKGAVNPVKNQGQCGSCWAFSTVGGLEGVYAVATGNLQSFSEQQIVDCSSNGGNSGCNGGDLPPAYDYAVQNGIENESVYPYTAVDGTCQYNASKVVFKPQSYTQVPVRDPQALVQAVAVQPVPICIEADQEVFQFYSGGIIKSGCGNQLDHCVVVVGYTDDAWVVRNSWGADWGESGYVRFAKTMTKGQPGVCGIYEEPVVPNYKQ